MSFIRHLKERTPLFGPGDRSRDRTVAIACQGGGSHAAFTAGVLGRLLDDLPQSYRVVGLSGASGGALSATAAWYGLVADEGQPGAVLRDLWGDIAASSGWELWVNGLTILEAHLSDAFAAGGSPYANPGSDWGRAELEAVLEASIDFDAFARLSGASSAPVLFVSAVEVLTGEPAVFRGADVTCEAVVASAAVPHLFEAVEIDGTYYWDGFLSQNPPIVEFLLDESLPPVDELWLIRLSPKSVPTLPTAGGEIDDRTRHLVENLSVTRDLRFVEAINDWLDAGTLSGASLTETTVRTIELHREQTEKSRLDRRSSFVDDLIADGEAEAANFLRELDPEGEASERDAMAPPGR